jgi:hypothetical protein
MKRAPESAFRKKNKGREIPVFSAEAGRKPRKRSPSAVSEAFTLVLERNCDSKNKLAADARGFTPITPTFSISVHLRASAA